MFVFMGNADSEVARASLQSTAYFANCWAREYQAKFMNNRNTRLGLTLFFLYLLFYGGFVGLAAFAPETMARTPWAGINLAIWYGVALIVTAILLALAYGWACGARQSSEGDQSTGGRP